MGPGPPPRHTSRPLQVLPDRSCLDPPPHRSPVALCFSACTRGKWRDANWPRARVPQLEELLQTNRMKHEDMSRMWKASMREMKSQARPCGRPTRTRRSPAAPAGGRAAALVCACACVRACGPGGAQRSTRCPARARAPALALARS